LGFLLGLGTFQKLQGKKMAFKRQIDFRTLFLLHLHDFEFGYEILVGRFNFQRKV
jgi:hypothetical protein